MTRRMMFRALLGVPILPSIVPTDERARMPVAPICPRCGLYVAWPSGSRFLSDPLPLFCPCGWVGAAPRSIPIPSAG